MTPAEILDGARAAGLEITLSPAGEVRARALRPVPARLVEQLRDQVGSLAIALGASDVAALRAQRSPPILEPGAAEVSPSLGRHRIDLAPDRCWSCGGVRLGGRYCLRCCRAYGAAGIRPSILVTREPWPVATPVAREATVPAPVVDQDVAAILGGRVVALSVDGKPIADEDF